ncbi:prepilin-type N-terminal cleavage/methylation domain-containing protein [Pantoea sp. 1.19]|uniref:prepilin-type N-terminal cleavage/methylation domain-containing protein n=1 Tax=Pantoea sp. 1.19 TaxID=1925589 RepID=UPI00147AD249|nr:prepilin-type N-terminal cleavage/methylation domain-containing protein [Pantoea sp. 1.19]
MQMRAECSQSGFSLVETLLALFLLALVTSLLLRGEQALWVSSRWQQEQRQAWRYAAHALSGETRQAEGWRITIVKSPTSEGCGLWTARAVGPSGRAVSLQRLHCDQGH